MIGRILRKDAQLLWPMILFVTLIQLCLEWVYYKLGFFGQDLVARELLRPLTIAWFVGIASLAAVVVQQDAVPALDQDWLIRPLRRGDLLLAKLLFVVLAICVPMLVFNATRGLASGFAASDVLREVALKELLVLAWLIVPVLALATLTSSMAELLLLGAALIGVYALGLSVGALLRGADSCPTCDTGLSWLEHLLQHIGALVGACLILALQYYRRATRWSRAVAIVGALALVLAQLSWGMAFALQRWLSPNSDAAVAVGLAFAPRGPLPGGMAPPAAERAPGAAQAARDLLAGDLTGAVKYLQAKGADRSPVAIELPIRATALGVDEFLLVDRTELLLSADDGRVLYRAINPGPLVQAPVTDDPARSAVQSVLIPAAIYRALARRPLRLQLRYSLTLMHVVAQHRIAARDGEFETRDLGRCATRVDQYGGLVAFRCKKAGPAPFCLSAALFGPDGRHNPEMSHCEPDYRPDLPSMTYAFSLYGGGAQVRDRVGVAPYPVDSSQLDQSYLLVRIFGVRAHFARTLEMGSIRLDQWRATPTAERP